MTITVTKQHIKHGRHNDACLCPIALALAEQCPVEQGDEWVVGPEFIVCNSAMHDLPELAQQFIADFDNKREVKPFSFEVNVRAQPEQGA